MCEPVHGTSVKLYVWYRNPLKEGAKEPKTCDLKGGHCALEIKKDGKRAYLGWWPAWWSVARPQKQPGPKHSKRRSFPGRLTQYPRQEAARRGTQANVIDSILVRNTGLGTSPVPVTPVKSQVAPTRTYDLCFKNMNVGAILHYINTFKPSPHNQYNFYTNNCATVCVAALKAGGARIRSPLWSPWFLEKRCKWTLACKKKR